MRKLALSLVILFGIAFSAFAENTLPAPKNNETRYDIIVVEGHHYLVVAAKTEQRSLGAYGERGTKPPSVSSAISLQVLHSFGCPCMTNKIQKIEIQNVSTNSIP